MPRTNGNTFQQLFLLGANQLATAPKEYGDEQSIAGFSREEWELLTQPECWTLAQQQKLKSLLDLAVSITLRTAGLPPTPLPSAFCAAVICKLVAPCNRLIAAQSAPSSYDAMSASGIESTSKIVITTQEQMYALVIYFSSAQFAALDSYVIEEYNAQLIEE